MVTNWAGCGFLLHKANDCSGRSFKNFINVKRFHKLDVSFKEAMIIKISLINLI